MLPQESNHCRNHSIPQPTPLRCCKWVFIMFWNILQARDYSRVDHTHLWLCCVGWGFFDKGELFLFESFCFIGLKNIGESCICLDECVLPLPPPCPPFPPCVTTCLLCTCYWLGPGGQCVPAQQERGCGGLQQGAHGLVLAHQEELPGSSPDLHA